jgi:prolyl 4-hydroxylase
MTAAFEGAQRVPTRQLELLIRKRFLSEAECAALIARIDADRRPSTIADDIGEAGYRTSETCDLDGADPEVAAIDARICAWLGLEPAHGEPIQGQRYAPGQEFRLHTDYFEPDGLDFERYCGVSGNRTWTAMIYLNAPAAGGATRFKVIDKTVQPEPGKLLAWNNRLPDGRVNPATLHAGLKVRAGVKYIITKWFRERARTPGSLRVRTGRSHRS